MVIFRVYLLRKKHVRKDDVNNLGLGGKYDNFLSKGSTCTDWNTHALNVQVHIFGSHLSPTGTSMDEITVFGRNPGTVRNVVLRHHTLSAADVNGAKTSSFKTSKKCV